MVKEKKIFLNKDNTKYCIVKLFLKTKDMLKFYSNYFLERGYPDTTNPYIGGASLHYVHTDGRKCLPDTGIVILTQEYFSHGIVAHELLHAVLWAYKHTSRKKQYPIIIKNMKEEEEILYNHTYAMDQFYKWYKRLKL